MLPHHVWTAPVTRTLATVWIPISLIWNYCPQVGLPRPVGVASSPVSVSSREVWPTPDSVSSLMSCLFPPVLASSLAWDSTPQWKRLFTIECPNFWAVVMQRVSWMLCPLLCMGPWKFTIWRWSLFYSKAWRSLSTTVKFQDPSF